MHAAVGVADAGAVAALRAADPVLRAADRRGRVRLGDVFAGPARPTTTAALVRSIVGQQLSTQAAAADLRPADRALRRPPPTPEEVLADDPDELRAAAGLSHAKVRYLRSLAEHVLDGSLQLERLDDLPDDEVIAELTAVKGIGEWSAHMFLMFHLQRPDVLAGGRPGDPPGGDDPLRVAGAAYAGRAQGDRRAVAPAPDAGVPVPVALAARDAVSVAARVAVSAAPPDAWRRRGGRPTLLAPARTCARLGTALSGAELAKAPRGRHGHTRLETHVASGEARFVYPGVGDDTIRGRQANRRARSTRARSRAEQQPD